MSTHTSSMLIHQRTRMKYVNKCMQLLFVPYGSIVRNMSEPLKRKRMIGMSINYLKLIAWNTQSLLLKIQWHMKGMQRRKHFKCQMRTPHFCLVTGHTWMFEGLWAVFLCLIHENFQLNVRDTNLWSDKQHGESYSCIVHLSLMS